MLRRGGVRPRRKGKVMVKDIVKDEEFLSKPAEPPPSRTPRLPRTSSTPWAPRRTAPASRLNQIGSTKAIIAFEGAKGPQVMFNPKDRCLHGSLQGHRGLPLARPRHRGAPLPARAREVRRARERQVRVSHAQVLGWVAEVVQHCVDHCAGKLV